MLWPATCEARCDSVFWTVVVGDLGELLGDAQEFARQVLDHLVIELVSESPTYHLGTEGQYQVVTLLHCLARTFAYQHKK